MDDRPLEDRQLLQRFVKDNSQEAFAALSARYLNLVYAVCRRELDDADLAEDVTQAVFLILARKAPSLSRSVVLSGWLFQTARFAAKNARLTAQRRAAYEQKAAAALMEQQAQTEDEHWAEIEPLLNQSLAALKAGERDCVLLRFFQGMSFAEAGASLGLSEDAARKRVTRSLDKMRQFFVKNGVIVPAIVLPALLTTHAAKAAPAACQANIAQLTTSVLTGHATAALTGSHAYQLSQGAMNAMKICQVKVAVGIVTAVTVVGAGTYGVVRSAASNAKPLSPIKIAQPPPPSMNAAQEALMKLLADSTLSQYRTVALTGKVRRADGVPIGKLHIMAKIQDAELSKLFKGESRLATVGEQEISASFAHTKPDGTYTLYVGAGFKYNVFITREDIMKSSEPDTGVVAAAAEGVSGSKGATVSVPDLVLTSGGIVTGTVTDKATGRPIAGAIVYGYGAQSPQSTTGVFETLTDRKGNYRLRVAPGENCLYEPDSVNPQSGADDNRYLEITEGETKTEDFQVTVKQP